jgi:elongation of very long chain fatty acids protein 1
MGSPYILMSMFAAYLWMIHKVLPEFMVSRKPFNLSTTIRIYNVFQVIACAYFVIKFHEFGFSFRNTWQCTQPRNEEPLAGNLYGLLDLHWFFIFLRLFEFVETMFFIVRKKFSQVSALHVYHHISTVALLWIHLKFNGGLMDIYIGKFINILKFS